MAYSSYESTPYIAGTQNARSMLFNYLKRAKTVVNGGEARTLRWMHLADSRGSTPGGAGESFEHYVGSMLASLYGNIPEMYVRPDNWEPNANTTSGWFKLARQNNTSAGATSTTKIPPACASLKVAQDYGNLSYLQFQNHCHFPTGASYQSYWNDRTSTSIDVIGVTAATSGDTGANRDNDVGITVRGNDTIAADFFSGTNLQVTTSSGMLLTSSSDFFRTATFGPYDWSSYKNLVTLITAKDTATPKNAEIAGVRYRNLNRTDGISFHMGGVGGYTYLLYTANRNSIGAWLSAMSIDVVYLQLNYNDGLGNGRTPEQFYADAQAYIDTLQISLPNAVFILDNGAFAGEQSGGDANYATRILNYNKFAGALEALALTYTNVLFFNVRRFTEEMGWTSLTENYDVTVPAAYSAVTTYAAGDLVTYVSKRYKSRVGSNLNNQPDLLDGNWELVHTRLADHVHPTEFGCQQYAEAIRRCLAEVQLTGRGATSSIIS